jgi:hypothetical protein
MDALILGIAIVATLAIFATTRPGREIAKRIGLRDHVKGAASSEDVSFLLSACGGDRRLAEERVRVERERLPDLTEAEHYRRAIRKVLAERTTSDSGTR